MTDSSEPLGSRSDDRPRVLLVEDEILIRLAAADTLRQEGYVVLEAADAAEALALLKADQAVDLVLTDVRMPGEMNGVALTREIKESWPHMPVVIVSGHLAPEKAHLADRFLRKPVACHEIAQVAKELTKAVCQIRPRKSKAS